MDKLEALILTKHGIKRAPVVTPAIPTSTNGAVETEEKSKRSIPLHAKPAN
jgi:hypothetical protein